MGVDPLAVVFDQQQLRQYLISNLKTGQCVPSSRCHIWSVAWWTPPPPSRPLTHALYLLCSNRKIWMPGTALLRCCMSNDSSSWHAASLSWPSTMWLGSCVRLSLVPTRTVASSTSPSCPAVHVRSVHMLLVGYAMEEEWECHAGPPRSWPSLHETA